MKKKVLCVAELFTLTCFQRSIIVIIVKAHRKDIILKVVWKKIASICRPCCENIVIFYLTLFF